MNKKLLETFVEETKHIIMTGVVVWQDGRKIAQYQWEPEIRQNQYSAAKSFTSTAVGIAIEEGLLKLDDLVLNYFPEKAPTNPSKELEHLTITHLLNLNLGQKKAYLMGPQRPVMIEKDWVKYCLSQSFANEPGTHFLYSNAGPYLAGMIVQKQTKCNIVEYLMSRLFKPLGIYLPTWENDPLGNTFGAGGLYLTVSEMAKFGQVYLQKGAWKGKQLIPKRWVEKIEKTQIETGNENPDKAKYSLLFWKGQHNSYRADGKYGQYSIVLPEKNAVVAISAFNRGQCNILDCLWKYIYPAL